MQVAIPSTSNPRNPAIEPESAIELVASLDFEMIKLKLQDEEDGPGWDIRRCEEAELQYRQFLTLKLLYPETDLVPQKDTDSFWHQHILDTAKYAEDCTATFGSFLHHYPYFGMQGEEDYAAFTQAGDLTRELHQRHFAGRAGNHPMNKCRTKCKPMKCK